MATSEDEGDLAARVPGGHQGHRVGACSKGNVRLTGTSRPHAAASSTRRRRAAER